ncbi:hypothetical protein AC249_AIPGENE8785, partial [Paramuricea clavata]
MPAPYSQDLRWRVIWLAEIVGLDLQEVSFFFQLSEMTIRRYVKKFRELGNVSTAIIGRPYNCIAIHPHEELVIFEILQQYPEKTLGEDKRITRTCGYNLKGRPAKIYRRYSNWGPRITAIPIISMEGILDVGFYRGHVNGETFLTFVNNVLVPCLLPYNGFNPRSIVILDNAAIHHTQEAINAINATGAMLIFLPAYSPDFMPCEELFAQVKYDIAWQDCPDPELMLWESFLQSTDEQIKNYIYHAGYMQTMYVDNFNCNTTLT